MQRGGVIAVKRATRAFGSTPKPPQVREAGRRQRVPLCSVQTLVELNGAAFKFPLEEQPTDRPARRRRALATGFVFLSADSREPRGFVNRCPHASLELDLDDSDFFCDGFLQCKAHGAFFDPETGICLRGPAATRTSTKDKRLQALEPLLIEIDGDQVVLVTEHDAKSRPFLRSTVTPSPLEGRDIETYRREKQVELGAALARHADEIAQIQRELHEKTLARLARFKHKDQAAHASRPGAANDAPASKDD